MTRSEAIRKAIDIVVYLKAHFAKSKEAIKDAEEIIEALKQINEEQRERTGYMTKEDTIEILKNIQKRFLDAYGEETSLYVLLNMDDIEAIDNAIGVLKAETCSEKREPVNKLTQQAYEDGKKGGIYEGKDMDSNLLDNRN